MRPRFRRLTKAQRVRNRFREKGYTEQEIESLEADDGDRRYHEMVEQGMCERGRDE